MLIKLDARQAMRYLTQLPDDKYLLHGSPTLTERLEPRQADCIGGDGKIDAEKSQYGVYASLWVRDAVVSAIVHNRRGWTVSEDLRTFTVLGEKATLGSGYLYVLPQDKFVRLSNVFWFISKGPVAPIRILEIGPDILKHLPDIVLPPHLTKPA